MPHPHSANGGSGRGLWVLLVDGRVDLGGDLEKGGSRREVSRDEVEGCMHASHASEERSRAACKRRTRRLVARDLSPPPLL